MILLTLILANIVPIIFKILLCYAHKYEEDLIILLDKL